MANLRRTKLKARRIGCDVVKVEKCKTVVEVQELVSKFINKKEVVENVVSE